MLVKQPITRLIGLSFLLFAVLTANAQKKLAIDSLHRLLTKEVSDTDRVNLFNQLAWEYRNSDFHLTDSFADIAITHGNKAGYHKGIGQAYINKALVERNAGNYATALQHCRWAMVHFIKSNYLMGYASAYNTIASIHYTQSDYSKAMLYYFHSLRYSEMVDDEKGAAVTLNNIGAVYMEQHAYPKSLLYYEKAYAILTRVRDVAGMAACLNNIGSIHHFQKNYEQAIANYEDALRINRLLGDKKDISSSLNNIGLTYYEYGDYKKALDNYHQSLVMDEQLGDINAIVVSYGNIANCYIRLKMYHAASKYASQALSLAKAFDMKQQIMDAYEMLYRIDEDRKDFESAFAHYKLFKLYSDSIFNSSSHERIAFLENEYLREKTEKENLLKTKQSEVNRIIYQEREKHIYQYIFIIGMTLLLFVVLIYVVFFILKRPKLA